MADFDGFDAISGGAAAPKSSIVTPEHDASFDPFAAASAAAVSQPLSNQAAPAPSVPLGTPSPVDAKRVSTPTAASSAAAAPTADEKKDTPYTAWEAKHKQMLAEKQARADELKKQLRETAKSDVAKFLAARDERIAQRKIENRSEEKSGRGALKSVMSNQTTSPFEKIGRLVDTSVKANEKRSGVDRFRKLLIHLKSNPPVHLGGTASSGSAAASDKDSKLPF